MNKQYRVGCIGTGTIAMEAHIPAYVSHRERLRITAIYDQSPLQAQRARALYLSLMKEEGSEVDWEISLCASAEELLEQVDIVDVCTSLRWHSHYSALALKANVNAMSEKPMARTWIEAQAVADAAKKTSAKFQLNDDNLFIPRYLHIRNVIESGMIGEVQQVWIARGKSSSDRREWFFDPIEAGGGSILDYGTHAVTSTWFMIGFDKIPQEIRSIRTRVKDRTRFVGGRLQEIEVDDDAHFKVRYLNPANGDWINVVIEATWAWPELGPDGSDVKGYIEVEGSEGSVSAVFDEEGREYVKVTNRVFGERWLPIKSYASEDLSFEDEISNLYRSVDTGQESMLNAERGVQIVKVINCAQLSELRGRKSVTFADLEAFTAEVAGEENDVLKIGDRMAQLLNEPYRKEPQA